MRDPGVTAFHAMPPRHLDVGMRIVAGMFVDIDEAGAQSWLGSLVGVRHLPLFLHCDVTDLAALGLAIALLLWARPARRLLSALANSCATPAALLGFSTGCCGAVKSPPMSLALISNPL